MWVRKRSCTRDVFRKCLIMTTDRYAQALARIDEEIAKCADFFDSAGDIYIAQSVIEEENVHLRWIGALRAVVELHKPEVMSDGEVYCSVCENTKSHWAGVFFPCPTADTIIEGVSG